MNYEGNQPEAVAERQRAFSKLLARTMALVGLLTVLIIGVTLAVGFWLGRHFGHGPLWTIGLLVGSIPVTTVMMYFVVRRAARGVPPPPPAENQQDEG